LRPLEKTERGAAPFFRVWKGALGWRDDNNLVTWRGGRQLKEEAAPGGGERGTWRGWDLFYGLKGDV